MNSEVLPKDANKLNVNKVGLYTRLEDKWYNVIEKLNLTKIADAIDKHIPSFVLFLIVAIIIILGIFAIIYFVIFVSSGNITFEFYKNNTLVKQDLNVTFFVDGKSNEVFVNAGRYESKFELNKIVLLKVNSAGYETETMSFVPKEKSEVIRVNITTTTNTNSEKQKLKITVYNSDQTYFQDLITVKLNCLSSKHSTNVTVSQTSDWDIPVDCGAVSASVNISGYNPIVDQLCNNNECKLYLTKRGTNPEQQLSVPKTNDLVVVVRNQNGVLQDNINITLRKKTVLGEIVDQGFTEYGSIRFDNILLETYYISAYDSATGATASRTYELLAESIQTIDLNLIQTDNSPGVYVNIISEDKNECDTQVLLLDEDENIIANAPGACGKETYIAINDYNEYSVVVRPIDEYRLKYKQYSSDSFELSSNSRTEYISAELDLFDFQEDVLLSVSIIDSEDEYNKISDIDVKIKGSKYYDLSTTDENGIVEFIVGTGTYDLNATNDYLEGTLEGIFVESPEDNDEEKLIIQEETLEVTWRPTSILVNIIDMYDSETSSEEYDELSSSTVKLYSGYELIAENDDCGSSCEFDIEDNIHAGMWIKIVVSADDRIDYKSSNYFLEGKDYTFNARLYTPDFFSGNNKSNLVGVFKDELASVQEEVITKSTVYFSIDVIITDDTLVKYDEENLDVSNVIHSGYEITNDQIQYLGTTANYVTNIIFESDIDKYSLSSNKRVGLKLTINDKTNYHRYFYGQRVYCSQTNGCFDVFTKDVLQSISAVYANDETDVYLRAYLPYLENFDKEKHNLFLDSSNSSKFNFDENRGFIGTSSYSLSEDIAFDFIQKTGKVIYDLSDDSSSMPVSFKYDVSATNKLTKTVIFKNTKELEIEGLIESIVKNVNNELSFRIYNLDSNPKSLVKNKDVIITAEKGRFNNNSQEITLNSATGTYDVNLFVSQEGSESSNYFIYLDFKVQGFVKKRVYINTHDLGFYKTSLNNIVIPLDTNISNLNNSLIIPVSIDITNLSDKNIIITDSDIEIILNRDDYKYTYADNTSYKYLYNRPQIQLRYKLNIDTTDLVLLKNAKELDFNLILTWASNDARDYFLNNLSYFTIPGKIEFTTTQNNSAINFTIPVIFSVMPKNEEQIINCEDINTYITQNDTKTTQLIFDAQNPSFIGKLHLENNSEALCKPESNSELKSYNILVHYIPATDSLDKDTNINIIINGVTSKLIYNSGFYKDISILVPANASIESYDLKIDADPDVFRTGKLFFEVRPVFNYYNTNKSYFISGKSDNNFYYGFEFYNNSALLNKIHNQILSLDRNAIFETDFISGDLENCVELTMSSSNTFRQDNRFINLFDDAKFVTLQNNCEGIKFNYQTSMCSLACEEFSTAKILTTSATILIPSTLNPGANILKVKITNNDNYNDELVQEKYIYINKQKTITDSNYTNRLSCEEYKDEYAELFNEENISCYYYSYYDTNIQGDASWWTENLFPDDATSELDFSYISEFYNDPGLYVMLFLCDSINNFCEFVEGSDGYLDIKSKYEYTFVVSENYLLADPFITNAKLDLVNKHTITRKKFLVLDFIDEKTRTIDEEIVSDEGFNVCSDDDCLSLLKPSHKDLKYTKSTKGYNGITEYDFKIPFEFNSKPDCSKYYCSLYQANYYLIEKYTTTQSINNLDNLILYLQKDNFTKTYSLSTNIMNALGDGENYFNCEFVGKDENPLGIISAGKYKTKVIDPDSENCKIKLIYLEGAVPSIFYDMPYDGPEGNYNEDFGTSLESDPTFYVTNDLQSYYITNPDEGLFDYTLIEQKEMNYNLSGHTILSYNPNYSRFEVGLNKCFDENLMPYICSDSLYNNLQNILTGIKEGKLGYSVDPATNVERVYYSPKQYSGFQIYDIFGTQLSIQQQYQID